ncbi:MAG: PqqD family protein [Gemmatimonadales bacterium]|nr:MAG: PqqD family protein [Gemmatimonadales bacterium]
MNSSILPSPRGSVIFKQMDDGAVLYCTDTEAYFGLNPVGVTIWRFLETGATEPEALLNAVHNAFPDAPAGDVRGDVMEFLDELREAGLVGASTRDRDSR